MKKESSKQEIIRRRNYLLGLSEDVEFQKYIAGPIANRRKAAMGTLRDKEASDNEIRQAQMALDFFDFFDGIFESAERNYQAYKEKELKNERSSNRANGARTDISNIRVIGPTGSGSVG